jgi:PLP dependent protein
MKFPGENIFKIKSDIPGNVKLIAVSKTVSKEIISEAYSSGHRIFGENKVQELLTKLPFLPPDIEWHFIGHLQSNKVKFIVPFISMIHSIESLKLLETVNNEAKKINRKIKCLLQVHIAKEETKYGFSEKEIFELLKKTDLSNFQNVEFSGLMGMASFIDDEKVISSEFKNLKLLFDKLKVDFFPNKPEFKEISMGMSSDYKIAINEGSTMIRVGSLIFGGRV